MNPRDIHLTAIEKLREKYGNYKISPKRLDIPDIETSDLIQQAYNLGVAEGKAASTGQARNDGYICGFEAAAKNPAVWCVEDHGEVFKIGDKIKHFCDEHRITGFCVDAKGKAMPQMDHDYHAPASVITKIQPDSWEKLGEDIRTGGMSDIGIIYRAKKLSGCDE